MSLFGQPAASGSLFGAPAPAAAPTSLFGAPTPAAPTSSAPSLFGTTPASTATPTPAAPTTSLFGAPAASTPGAAAPKPAFSFGAPPAPAAGSAPAAGGGLFGAAPTPAAPAGGGLFGASAAGSAAPAAGGGGLFGAGAAATPAPAAGGGLFGAGVGTAGKSLFGSAPAAAPAPGLATTAAPLGASTATGATPGQPAAITKRTKLEELPAAAKSLIEQIDAGIRAQVGMCEELKGRDLGAGITATGDKYLAVLSESTTTTTLLTTDSRTVADLKQSLEVDLEDVNKFVKIVEGYKNPNKDGAGAAAKSVAGFPFEYFERKLKEFKEKLARYRGVMDQIQQLLESSHSASSPAAILPTLRAQHASFMSLASLIATLTSELERVKDDYRLIWRAKTGSVVDPFRLAGSGSNGVDGVTRGVGGLGVAR